MRNINFGPFKNLILVLTIVLSTLPVRGEELKPDIADALNIGDTTRAITLINKEIEVDPNYHFNYYMLGRIYFEQEIYSDAKNYLEIARDKKKKFYESTYYLALTLIQLDELDLAEKLMTEGQKKAKDLKALFEDGHGLVMLAKKNYSEADRDFRRAISIDSTIADFHIHLGDANFYQGIPSLATMEYEKALAIDTAGKEVYFHWAEACLEMKDYACAIEKLQIVLSKDSTHAPAWNRAAGIYFKAALSSRSRAERTNRFKEVIGSYRRYLELSGAKPDSAHVRPYFELAMAYLNVNGFEEAVENFEKVLSIPYEPRDIYFNFGKALWGMRDYVKSGDMLLKHEEWVEAQGDDYRSRISDAEFYQLLGDSYYYRKPPKIFKAVSAYQKSLAERPEQKRLVQNVAVGYHRLKSYKQAIEFYQKRIDMGIDSTSTSLIKNASYCALALAKNESEGEDDLLEEEELDEDMPMAIETEPDTTDYFRVATELMEEYLKYEPNDIKVLTLVGNTYLFNMNDCTNGVKYFEKLATLAPDSCTAPRALGYAYFGGLCNKNYPRALKYLGEAYDCTVANGGACSDVDLVLWIAQANHLHAVAKSEAGEDAKPYFKAANEWYNKVIKCDPNNNDAKEGIKQTQFEF